jgi:hypothetical protein
MYKAHFFPFSTIFSLRAFIIASPPPLPIAHKDPVEVGNSVPKFPLLEQSIQQIQQSLISRQSSTHFS